MHENVQVPDWATGDDLESRPRLTRIVADILPQSLHEGLHHVAAKQMQVHGPLPGVGVPPVTPQDQAPEQGEIGALLDNREEILLVDRYQRPARPAAARAGRPAAEPLARRPPSGARRNYPPGTSAPISARPAISDRRSSDFPLVAMAPIRLGRRRRGAAVEIEDAGRSLPERR